MNSGVPMPSKVLLALTTAVLVAHAWMLRGAPSRVQARVPVRPPVFAIRRIEPVAAAAPAAPRQAVPRSPPAARVLAAPDPGARRKEPAAAPAPEPPPAAPAKAAPAGPEFRVAVPEPVRLRYAVTARVRQQQLQGTSELQWRRDGDAYEALFEWDLPSLPQRRQHSAGVVTATGIEPRRFAERWRGEQATHFERDAGRISFSNNRPAAVLDGGAQDRLSVLLQLAALLAGEPGRYPPGASVALQTATTREAQAWVFTVEREELLALPGGDMTTVKLIRPAHGEYDQHIEVWLAPGAAYVPVRLRLTQPNGDWVDHLWSATDRR